VHDPVPRLLNKFVARSCTVDIALAGPGRCLRVCRIHARRRHPLNRRLTTPQVRRKVNTDTRSDRVVGTRRKIPTREVEDSDAVEMLLRLVPDGIHRKLWVRWDTDGREARLTRGADYLSDEEVRDERRRGVG
jgi:hypothetical protein